MKLIFIHFDEARVRVDQIAEYREWYEERFNEWILEIVLTSGRDLRSRNKESQMASFEDRLQRAAAVLAGQVGFNPPQRPGRAW